MIIEEKLDKSYKKVRFVDIVWFKCDYCGAEFQRQKHSREKCNKHIQKDSCGAKECKLKKKEEVSLLLHGETNIFKTNKFKDDMKEKCLKENGVEYYSQTKNNKEKRKKTSRKNWGVDHPMQSSEVRTIQQESCEKVWGVKNISQHPDFKEMQKNGYQEASGFDHPMLNPVSLKKREDTCESTFGKRNYTQTEEYWTNRTKKCLDEKGVLHESQLPENRAKAKETMKSRYDKDYYSQTDESKLNYRNVCMERLGVPNPLCLTKNQKYGKAEKELKDWLNSMGFSFENDYLLLEGKEIDLYDPKINVAIEYCGLFWHNEDSPQPRDVKYHYDKYIKCLEKGIRLITIFEDEWKFRNKQVKGFLQSVLNKNTETIYARKCKVQQVNRKIFNEFCNQNHIQYGNNLGSVFFVLEYKKEIVAAMSLGRHHRGYLDIITLDRFCVKSGINVVGGAARLFERCKEWANNNNKEEIRTWSDNRWSQGNVYKKLGFELLIEEKADYSYVSTKKPKLRYSKQSQQKKKTNCPPELTEVQWANARGFSRIWDCGKKTWIYKIKEE